MIDLAVVGLGKMGLSHLSMIKAHPDVNLVGVCDAAGYLLDILNKYTGVTTFKDYPRMLDQVRPDAVLIATPTHLHASMVREALSRGIHVFCEKPLFIEPADGVSLTRMAKDKGLVTQVGYHNRFVASFAEVQRLVQLGTIGSVNSALAEAYGPVVLKPAGRSWRSQRVTGGGCLYDYAAHPLNLLTWYLGSPEAVGGSKLTSIFSAQIDDAVASTLQYPSGTAQLSVNWSDESQRKMTTKITLWGPHGRIYADRQEIQVFLRETATVPEDYQVGWNVRYTTEMTEAPWFYLRGEEYSAQLDAFVQRVERDQVDGLNDFDSAAVTDQLIAAIVEDSQRGGTAVASLGTMPVAAMVTREDQSRLRRIGSAVRQGARGVAQAFRGRGVS